MAKTPMELLEMLLPFLKNPPAPPSPTEDEPPEHEREIGDIDPVDRMPQGKGIFVQSVELATKGGNAESLAQRAKDLGLDWIALLVIWQHDDRDRIYTQVESAIAACRRLGIDVWLWGWPESAPSRIDKFVAFTANLVHTQPVKGFLINAEKPFYGKAAAARDLCTELKAAMQGEPIGLSSYGPPYFHPKFPWAPFAEICDYGAPQIYDSKHTLGAKYPSQCMAGWRKVGFANLVPTLGASNHHTAAQMKDMIERTPRAPAIMWWDLNWVKNSTLRAAVIRDMTWFKNA